MATSRNPNFRKNVKKALARVPKKKNTVRTQKKGKRSY